jgi:hypothetical protein
MHSDVSLTASAARALRISAWICLALAIVLWTGPSIIRQDVFDGDATQHVFWLYRYADPTLFPNDISIEYFASPSVAPWGYRALYAVLASSADAQRVAEIVAAVLLAISIALAWKLGVALVDAARPMAGLIAVVVTIALLPVNDLLPPMGLQRTFALPITLLCLWALVARRYQWVGVSWLAAALFYPILIVVLGLTAGIVFLRDLLRERHLPPKWQWNVLLGVVAIALVLFGSSTAENVGPMVTHAQALHMPEFGPLGRQDLFGPKSFGSYFGQPRTGLGWSRKMLLAMGATFGLALVLGRRRLIPPAAWTLAGVGIVTWWLARVFLFHLYLPNRHSKLAIAAFAIVAFTAGTYALVQHLASTQPQTRKWPAWVLACIAPVVVVIVLLPQAAAAWQRPVDQDMERAYEFIASLPKDCIVAAHPDLANDVPLRTRRSVLVSTEESIAFMQGYYRRLVPRIESSLQAAYATSWDQLEASLAPYDVAVMLTAPTVWKKTGYYAPFDKLARQLLTRGRHDGFVLRVPPPDRILFRSGDVYVLRVGDSCQKGL